MAGDVVRRIGLALLASAVAWLAASVAARWLFESGNALVWIIAAAGGVNVYHALPQRQHHG